MLKVRRIGMTTSGLVRLPVQKTNLSTLCVFQVVMLTAIVTMKPQIVGVTHIRMMSVLARYKSSVHRWTRARNTTDMATPIVLATIIQTNGSYRARLTMVSQACVTAEETPTVSPKVLIVPFMTTSMHPNVALTKTDMC